MVFKTYSQCQRGRLNIYNFYEFKLLEKTKIVDFKDNKKTKKRKLYFLSCFPSDMDPRRTPRPRR